MQIRKRLHRITLLMIMCLIIICVGSLSPIPAQDSGSRGLRPEDAGVKINPKRKKKRTLPITFKTHTQFKPVPAPAGTEYAQVGLTLWRVAPAKSRGIKEVGEEQTQETQERLDTNASYTVGDKIRLSIVSPTGGYLYIVDQEQYSDGTYGPAMLAFPTLGLNKGDNLIKASLPIRIPREGKTWEFYLRDLKPGEVRRVQTAEVFTIIVSPKPLVDRSRITKDQLKLNEGEFEKWQTQWKSTPQQFDMENSVGQVVQTNSRGVGKDGKEDVDDEEADAQTIYLVAIKPGAPIMVTLPLRFAAATAPAEKKVP